MSKIYTSMLRKQNHKLFHFWPGNLFFSNSNSELIKWVLIINYFEICFKWLFMTMLETSFYTGIFHYFIIIVTKCLIMLKDQKSSSHNFIKTVWRHTLLQCLRLHYLVSWFFASWRSGKGDQWEHSGQSKGGEECCHLLPLNGISQALISQPI